LYGYHITRNYRKSYNLFAANGILFNHESPRRGSNFVTNKIIKTAVEIKFGITGKLVLGNLESFRDWGHSKDYVRAMHMILNHSKPDDFVVATGQARSVREFVEIVFNSLSLNYLDYVVQDPRFFRPEELPYLQGDSSKIRETLGWEPQISFEDMLNEMTEMWIQKIHK
jgi:GDPmannose 4,6-dehydratase